MKASRPWKKTATLSRLIKECGPVHRATRKDIRDALLEPRKIFSLIINDTSRGAQWSGGVGFYIINVDSHYIFTKPIPEPVEHVIDVYHGEGGLPK